MGLLKDSQNPYLTFAEQGTAPATPATGLGVFYFKSADSKPYAKNDAGTEYDLTGGGGSGASTSSARVTTASSQSFTSGTEAAVTWESEDWDDAAYHDTVTNNTRFTAPAAGRYRMTFGYGLTASKVVFFSVRKNGTTEMARQPAISFSGFSTNGQCFAIVDSGPLALAAGDYLEATVLHFNVAGSGSTTRDSGIPAWAAFERIT